MNWDEARRASHEEMLVLTAQYQHSEIMRELNEQSKLINSSPFQDSDDKQKALDGITREINKHNDKFHGRI
jgi:hypothetical protein